jgi:predicted nucleic acid-binding protein
VPFVLDGSAAFAFVAPDEEATASLAQRIVDDDALVPMIWPLEVANAVLRSERRGRMTADQGLVAADALAGIPVTIDDLDIERALRTTLEVARAHGLTAYDASYLELAMRHGIPLATNDAHLRRAAIEAGVALVE